MPTPVANATVPRIPLCKDPRNELARRCLPGETAGRAHDRGFLTPTRRGAPSRTLMKPGE